MSNAYVCELHGIYSPQTMQAGCPKCAQTMRPHLPANPTAPERPRELRVMFNAQGALFSCGYDDDVERWRYADFTLIDKAAYAALEKENAELKAALNHPTSERMGHLIRERDELQAELNGERRWHPHWVAANEEINRLRAELAAEKERSDGMRTEAFRAKLALDEARADVLRWEHKAAKLHKLCGERMTERDLARERVDDLIEDLRQESEWHKQARDERNTARAVLTAALDAFKGHGGSEKLGVYENSLVDKLRFESDLLREVHLTATVDGTGGYKINYGLFKLIHETLEKK
jgi:hypothetical protein